MASAGTIQLKVTPEQLESKANTVTGLIRTIKTNFNTLSDVMQRTNGYWIGEAADKHRKLYSDKKDEIETMIRRLEEHPRDLLTMAGVYREAETSNVSTSQGLPTNVIA